MNPIKNHILFLFSFVFFILAIVSEHQTINKHPEKKHIEIFQQSFLTQNVKLSDYLDKTEKKLKDSLLKRNYISEFSSLNDLFENEGLGFFIFNDSKLVYWSSNQFAFPNLQARVAVNSHLLILPNGIFSIQKRKINDHLLVGLVLLKNNFSYENQFLKNTFVAPFKLPANFKLIPAQEQNAFPIYNHANEFLFSVLPSGEKVYSESQLYLPFLLYILGFALLLFAVYIKAGQYPKENFIAKMLLVLVVLFLIYWAHIIFGIPAMLDHIGIFTAQYYALSTWLPSLGDFFLITLMFFFWSLVFVREFVPEGQFRKRYLIPAFAFAGLLYELAGLLIGNLIRNSNISYKLNRITDIDLFSIGSYLAIAMLLFSVFLIHLKIIEKTEHLIRKKLFMDIHLIAVPISIVFCFLFDYTGLYLLALFFAVNLLQCQIKRMQISRYSLSYSILFISLFSVTSLIVIYSTIKKRDFKVQKLRAITLSSEQDPNAEVYLARIQSQFNTDSIIPKLLVPPFAELESYLSRTYFSGYFRKYDIQYTICSPSDSVIIQPENIWEPCFPFFEKMIVSSGIKVPGSNFFFMNNMNGRISYLGKLHYPTLDGNDGTTAFIEINSKIISEGIGFPELLMDQSLIKPFRYKYLSNAKFFEEELVDRSGEYDYNRYLQSYNLIKPNQEFQLLKWDGYDHLIYTVDKETQIIVSNKSLRFVDYLISFPYIFVFYFLFVLSITLIGNSNFRKMIIPRDLRFRIQVSIISVVLISLLFVASGTIYYNILEYNERHKEDLHEKMKSISEEIKNRLNYVSAIDPELRQWLYRELNKLSNIFRTDINIYNIKGELLATSRPEIFTKGVISEQMNAKAFYELSERYQLNYFHPEKNGKLSYLSAYEPIINSRGDYLGYLNLPYFTREDDLKQGISTFIVAFINLYLLLFLASVILAVVLSNRITQPLGLIREKLRSVQLGKKSEQISYKAEDEIGELVKEYNHKVEELSESAELLARSERESAWREMAKQIAHEIKNPLTPMKLNIQYLQRAKKEGNEQYDDFFERVTQNLIDQIDTLSGIATEFSNFAQIPKAKNEDFNLIEILKNVCALFENNNNLNIRLATNNLTEIRIFADKEQLSRAFLNIIKNGIQAIPANQKGEILVSVTKDERNAIISIQDNGTGISPEAQKFLFEPNFTTKTSGMGLGLSIVRNIMNSCNGKIWHETSPSDGTTFFVEIPLHETTSST